MSKRSKQLRDLQKENQRLKRENMMLKTELEEMYGHKIKSKRSKYQAALQRQAKTEQLFSKKRYFGYVTEALKRTSIFQIYSKIIHAIRKFTFIRITLLILMAILTAIQSSAVFVIATSFFVVSLPFTLLVSNSAMILTFFGRRRINQTNRQLLQGKDVVVFFPPKGYTKEAAPFLCGMIKEFSQQENHICVVVSPYVFGRWGVFGDRGRPYFCSRTEATGVIIVRSAYYFTLKKKVFSQASSVTEIY